MDQRLCAWLKEPIPPGMPPDDVVASARREGVHLVLADRCRLPRLADELRSAAVVDAIRVSELRRVLAALADAGVEAVVMKGAALAHSHYARPELRTRSDADLMIPEHARDRVAAALVPIGYQRAMEVDGDVAFGQFHFVSSDRHGVLHALDIHWRVSNVRVFADVLSYQELRRDARLVAALGPHGRAASPVHALVLACIHRVAHHDDTRYLLWLLDVHLLARAFTPGEREAFARLAAERRMRAVCDSTLRLSQEAFGNLGAAWQTLFTPADHADEPSRAFIGGGRRQAEILLSDFAATAGAVSKWRLIRQHLLPHASYMRARYPRWPAALLPIAYVVRIVSALPRWVRRGGAARTRND